MWTRAIAALLVLTALLPGQDVLRPRAVAAAEEAAQPMEYVPRPASSYALRPADVGPSFLELGRDESEDGARLAVRLVPSDVRQFGEVLVSPTDVGFVDNWVSIEPYGSDELVQARFNATLDLLRSRFGANVQPAAGWGSEQVYSYAWAHEQVMYRGVALKHRNAVVLIEMLGPREHATWDRVSSLTRIVERRIHAALR